MPAQFFSCKTGKAMTKIMAPGNLYFISGSMSVIYIELPQLFEGPFLNTKPFISVIF